MSWQAINDMLGRAVIDEHFATLLLADPLSAAQEGGFDLTQKELEVLRRVKSRDIVELSQFLLIEFKKDEQRGVSAEG